MAAAKDTDFTRIDRLPRTAKTVVALYSRIESSCAGRVVCKASSPGSFRNRTFFPIREKLPELTVARITSCAVVNSMFRKCVPGSSRVPGRMQETHARARRNLQSRLACTSISILLIQLSPKSGRSICEPEEQTSVMLLHDMMNKFSSFGFSSPCESVIHDKVILSFRAATLNFSPHAGNGIPSAPLFF